MCLIGVKFIKKNIHTKNRQAGMQTDTMDAWISNHGFYHLTIGINTNCSYLCWQTALSWDLCICSPSFM